jgi:hypothetical protein
MKKSSLSMAMMAALAAGMALPTEHVGRPSPAAPDEPEKPRELTKHDLEALEEARQKRERKALSKFTRKALSEQKA